MHDPRDRHDPDSPAEPAPDPLKLLADNERLRTAMRETDEFICQTLAQALGYPWYKDDTENFPEATEESGVCVGEHTSDSLALDAADLIRSQREHIAELKTAAEPHLISYRHFIEAWETNGRQRSILDHDNLRLASPSVGDYRRLAHAVERVK